MRILLASPLFFFAMLPLAAAKSDAPPNFLFIIADDCTFRDIGCYGGQAHTPNIDRLATEGMKFDRCFQAAPMCSPTRHNIYTGLYPVKSGAYPNHTHVEAGVRSVVDYLKPLGYRVALSGKKHIGPRQAFEFEYSGANNPDMAAVEKLFAESHESKTPFCLFACSNEPHTPWNKGDASRYDPARLKLPANFVDTRETRSNFAAYLAEVAYFDSQVGQCLELLDRHGLRDNTLILVVSEQGSSFPFGKWTCYDTGLQSALIARWPGQIKPGTTTEALVEYTDVLPTFLDAAGGKPAAVLQGRSFLPVLRGETDEHKRYVFGEMTTRGINAGSDYFGIRSIRSARYKYILNFTPEVTFRNACTQSDIFQSWQAKAAAGDADAADKVRRYRHRPAVELYDMAADPLEWNNLAGDPKLTEVQSRLRRELEAWMKEQGDLGQETELRAREHQGGGRKKSSKRAG